WRTRSSSPISGRRAGSERSFAPLRASTGSTSGTSSAGKVTQRRPGLLISNSSCSAGLAGMFVMTVWREALGVRREKLLTLAAAFALLLFNVGFDSRYQSAQHTAYFVILRCHLARLVRRDVLEPLRQLNCRLYFSFGPAGVNQRLQVLPLVAPTLVALGYVERN